MSIVYVYRHTKFTEHGLYISGNLVRLVSTWAERLSRPKKAGVIEFLTNPSYFARFTE